MNEQFRYTPIHELPENTLVDEPYLVTHQILKPLLVFRLLVIFGLVPRPVLVKGKRHWNVTEYLKWLNSGTNE